MTTCFPAALCRKWCAFFLLLAACCCFLTPVARAGLTFHLNINHFTANDGTYYYAFECWSTTTNGNGANPPYGDYYMTSPNSNEVSALFHYDTNGWGFQTGGYGFISDFSDMVNRLTNGDWTILYTNLTATASTAYTFKVSLPPGGFTTNDIPDALVTFPANDSTITDRNPTFTWTGPTNYDSISFFLHNEDHSFEQDATLPPTQTSRPAPATLPPGTNDLDIIYFKNPGPAFGVTTPVDIASHAISEWDSLIELSSAYSDQFVIPFPPPTIGFSNVMHYTFDDSSSSGADSSPNHFDINCTSVWSTNTADTASGDAIAGPFARQFYSATSITVACAQDSTLNAWSNTLSGSFSVSAWIKSSTSVGNDDDDLQNFNSQSVVYFRNNDQGTVPIGMTGNKLAFFTGDPDGNKDTLHSVSDVITGDYVHVVVTRDIATGIKQVYVNGVMEAQSVGSTEQLSPNMDMVYQSIGGYPNSTFTGIVDDVQIYSGILTSNAVAFLHNNPGSVAQSTDFNSALETVGLPWTTSGDLSWFVETNDTPNSNDPSAAQSGAITGSQTSTISATVTGPGILNFWWKNNNGGDMDLEFDLDGDYQDDIGSFNDWRTDGPFNIPSGQHTLSWTAFANGDTDTNEAVYLDMVSYSQITGPTITTQPFDQTNYPGYTVGLIAAVSTNSGPVNWQWYKLGVGLIPNATNAFYSPTNSGTAGAAGQYYAIASNSAGSDTTRTALVTFVSAPLPPDWSIAFKSAFQAQDATQTTTDYYYGAVLADTNGDLYAAAEFEGNMMVGSSNLYNSHNAAAALVKQASNGAPIWGAAITNNGNGSAYSQSIALAPGGGAYLSGNYQGTVWSDANQLPVATNGGMFLARFDANGNNIWVKTFSTTNGAFTLINSLVADPSGNVTFVGLFNGNATIGANNFTVTGQESILAQLDANGNVRWAQKLPGEFGQYLAYSAGRLYLSVTPSTSGGATNIIAGGITNATDRTWGLAALDYNTGQGIWARGVGTLIGSSSGNPYSTGLVDDVPRIAVAGPDVFIVGAAYDSTATFGNITVNFNSLRGQYVVRYDTNGNAQVATTFGSVTTTPLAAVADGKGNVYVDGDFDNYSFFGQDMLAAARHDTQSAATFGQAFLAKFDHNGNPLWARQAVSPSVVNFLGIALAPDGVWASGFCVSSNINGGGLVQTAFGTNLVFSDPLYLVGPAGSGITILWQPAGVLAKVTDVGGGTTVSPITLMSQGISGGNYQFSFVSTAGHTNTVQYSTNIPTQNWQTYTNIVGDGATKTILVPTNNPGQKFFRVSTQ